jgi:polar amino acid transport system substrate-binding protein
MKKIISLILTLALAVSSLFVITSCNGGSEGNSQKEKLIVGITDYEPMDYKDPETGEWIGFDAELAKMFAESIGRECVFVEIDWDNKVAEINNGSIDLIWNGMTASEELGTKIDFSVSYAKNAQVAVAKKNSGITKEQVPTLSIAVEGGSAGETVANDIKTTGTIVDPGDQVAALTEVVSGNSQVAIVDLTLAQSVLGKGAYADLEMIEGVEYGAEVFAVGLKQGNEMKAELDAFLKAKYADGTMDRLLEKYAVVLNTEALSK